jgi:hypothetical protein
MAGRTGMMLGCKKRPAGLKAPLLMAKYLKDLPPAPEKVYREYKIPDDAWGMFGNDTIGDCTCAAIAHMLMLVTAHTGTLVVPAEADVIDFYSAVSGYNPVTGANDNGSDLPTVLNRWRDVGLSGHQIDQWGDIDPANIENQKHGIHIFGGTDDAVNLPNSAMDQFQAGQPWDVVADDGGIDGGHSIPRFGYGSDGFACITWATDQKGGTAWWQQYLSESCVVITKDWINNADGLTPSGFPIDALIADLAALKA